eukprot:TRINITY_DN1442_c0_g1_i6.p1 TRINITY_DN1442_c0_g1~~TRINITY_DN1442_c0_g1_i6.p1  ORF type:complete len:127 (-),score=56.18 TRINITY_DN1442_c0_g1_i6:583-963(-)
MCIRDSSNPPTLLSGFGEAVRTVVFRFGDSTAATAAIAKAKDGSLSSVGVTGASAVNVPAAPADNDDDGKKKTIIIAVVVSVVALVVIGIIVFVVKKRSSNSKHDDHEEMRPSESNFLNVPKRELV